MNNYLFIVVGVPMQDNKQGIITIFVTEVAKKIFLGFFNQSLNSGL